MKRLLLVIILFFTFSAPAMAAHIIGGEMRYAYVGPGSAPNTNSYRITMILFKDNAAGALLQPFYLVGVFNNDNGVKVPGIETNSNWRMDIVTPPGITGVPIVFPTCIQNAPTLDYVYASYTLSIDLPVNEKGYTITHQTCCRIDGMQNLGNSTGSTFTCSIPGPNLLGSGHDSSPAFSYPINVVCKNAPFTLDFSAVDPDPGDSLVYSFCSAYNGGGALNTGFVNHAPPPYGVLSYTAPYNGSSPMGNSVTINSNTGLISGIAPDFGKYLVNVCINVYRGGVLIANHRKELIVQVSDCVLTKANPMPDFTNCDAANGLTVSFFHASTGANSVFWDFGVTSLTNDTSIQNNPTYTYPDTGTYTIKFIINKGTGCVDSVTRKVGVYPGFSPGFLVDGACYQNTFRFIDTSRARYGVVNGWRWNFGDLTTLADTSRIQNPNWLFSTPGTKTAQLIVTSNKGCIDTADVTFEVLDKPIITLAFKDTLICRNDAVQLNAEGNGAFSWTPLINIINPNTPNPTVSPTVTTTYYVRLNDNGCINDDSVRVRVVNVVTLRAANDTTICLGDPVQLNASSDGLQFSWSPAATLNNPNIINPIATPGGTTTYTVVATIGSCRAADDVVVRTVPYPRSNAGPDPRICYNTSTQLNGSIVGIRFEWQPTSYLNNPNILNPISTPPRTTQYILLSYDTLGCPKPGRDTIVVNVQPRVRAFAGNDTTVVVNQPLFLQASGGVNYVWSPTIGLSNPNISNPVGVYNASIDTVRYKVVVRDAIGCPDSAYMTVRVFQTLPSVFVPTAFTPNGDGLNDEVYPIAVGIRRILYFSIYNRWGQLVFTTTQNKKGWDGKINGRTQDSNVFVWMVSAEDYLGKSIFLKGTVTLIR
ncbi:MAG: PKD domain-containing protein [Bacteroidetes bacterium]|nr:PKD domain-containing protein [Bacteroidota bacterium]